MKTRVLKQPRAFDVADRHRIRGEAELHRKLQSLFAFRSYSVYISYSIFRFRFDWLLKHA